MKSVKKKVIPVIAAAAALSAVALAGCGLDGQLHTHSYEWESNKTSHWQVCSCGDKTAEEAHVDAKINETGAEGKDELCDVCGANLHEHTYEWKSNPEVHWQECTDCDAKTAENAHADVKNNETGADGADEKCDDCGRGFYAVTFDLQGHGTAPAAQYVGADGHAAKPADPADDGNYKFKGWYKDSKCTTEFVFADEAIKSATVVYALFDMDPGACEESAYPLTLDVANPQKAKPNEVVYYSFTATATGRYTVSLGLGTNNENAKFKTDLTGDTEYGKDCAASEIALDIDAKGTVYIAFTYLGEAGDDISVSPLVTEVVDEPLPAYFLAGEYYNNAYSLTIDTEHKTGTFGETPFTFRYIGGKFDRIYFVQSTALGETTFYLSHDKDGKFTLSKKEGNKNETELGELQYFVAQDPIPLEKFAGLYEPKDSAGDGISQIGIFADGSGYLVQNDTRYEQEFGTYATFNQKRNTLTFGQYSFTLNLDGDTVTGINVTGGAISGSLIYERKGDAVATTVLPLTGLEYVGSEYTIAKSAYGNVFCWGSNTGFEVTVKSYDGDDTYTVVHKKIEVDGYNSKIVETDLKLVLDGENVKLYAADGTTLLDTLIAFVPEFHDLPASGAAQTLEAADFQKSLYWFKVKKSGWYILAATGDATTVYYGLDENDPANTYGMGVKQAGSAPINLAADTLIGVCLGNDEDAPITFTATETEAPAGLSADKPLDLVNGKGEIAEMDGDNKYYIRYANVAPGTYAVGCVFDSYGKESSIHFKIGDYEYGYSNATWQYSGGVTADFPYAIIQIDETSTLNIVADRIDAYGTENVTVYVVPYYGASGTAVTEDSGTLTAGTYKLGSFDGVKELTLSGDEFTVECKGVQTAGEITLTAAQLKLGFKLTGSASYEIVYEEGSAKNPVIVTGAGKTDVEAGQYVQITAPADQDVVLSLDSFYDTEFCFTYNGEDYGYESTNGYSFTPIEGKLSLSIAKGTTVTVKVFCKGYPYSGDITVNVACDYSVDAADVTLIKGEPADDKITAIATVSQTGNYYLASSDGSAVTVTSSAAFTIKLSNGTVITGTEAEGVYSALLGVANKLYFNVAVLTQPLTFTAEYAKGSAGYPLEITLENDSYELPVKPGEDVYFTLPEGKYAFTTDNVYLYLTVYVNGKAVDDVSSVTVTATDVLSVYGGSYGYELTIAPAEDVPDPPAADTDKYVGTDEETGREITFEVNADFTQGKYTVVAYGSITVNQTVTITQSGDKYSFTYTEEGAATKVEFTVVGDTLVLVDEYYTTGFGNPPTVITKQADTPPAEVGTAANPFEVVLESGSASVTLPEYEEYYIELPAGEYSIVNDGNFDTICITHSDETYDLVTIGMTPAISFTVAEGDVVSFVRYWGAEITITAVTE